MMFGFDDIRAIFEAARPDIPSAGPPEAPCESWPNCAGATCDDATACEDCDHRVVAIDLDYAEFGIDLDHEAAWADSGEEA